MSTLQRISIVGNAGSGKSTLAAELAQILGIPHIELDAIFHQPNWTPLEESEFRRQVQELAAAPAWVLDGNYTPVRDLIWGRANTVIWLDLPRHVVMTRVIKRTLHRVITRRELWNGNRERWQFIFSRDPYNSIILWAWTQHRRYQTTYQQAATDPAWSNLQFIRIQNQRDLTKLLTTIKPAIS